MRKLALALGLVAVLGGVAGAHDAYDESQSNPLRIVAYILNPVGWTAEWLVFRPIHFVVSQPALENIFGHEPHEYAFGNPAPYEPVE